MKKLNKKLLTFCVLATLGVTGSAGAQSISGGISGGTFAATGTGLVVRQTSPALITPDLGTPSVLILNNATGLPIGSLTGTGTGILTSLAINVGSAGAPVLFNGAGGTPSSIILTNGTSLPVGSLTGLGANVATGLALTLNGTGAVSGTTSPVFVTPELGAATAATSLVTPMLSGGSGASLIIRGQTGFGISFQTNGSTARWNMPSAGGLVAGTDNNQDIGASGATRPRTIYVGTSVVTPLVTATTVNTSGTETVGTAVDITGANGLRSLYIRNGGLISLYASDASEQGRLQGSTSTGMTLTSAGLGADKITLSSAAITVTSTLFTSALTAAAGTPNSICQNNATKEIVVNAALTCTVSSRDYKDNIKEFSGVGLKIVSALKPTTFSYKDNLKRDRIGFIAEELAEVDIRLAEVTEEGKPNSIDFSAMMGVLTMAIQEQQVQIKELTKRIEILEKASQ